MALLPMILLMIVVANIIPSSAPFYVVLNSPSDGSFQFVGDRGNKSMVSMFSRSDLSKGLYLARVGIGSPPFEVVGIADTSSSFSWTQCEQCTNCFPQNSKKFNPFASSTYAPYSCDSEECIIFPTPTCAEDGSFINETATDECSYKVEYEDGSYSKGVLAADWLTLFSSDNDGNPISFPGRLVGCGYDNVGNFSHEVSGVIGLGPQPQSLVRQIFDHIDGTFSYCLPPLGSGYSSKLVFGADPDMSPMASTALNLDSTGLQYELSMRGIRAGSTEMVLSTPGPIVIRSSTALTYVDEDLFRRLTEVMLVQMPLDPMENPPKPFELCYYALVWVPQITLLFDGPRGELPLEIHQLFLRLQPQDSGSIYCLSIVPATPNFGVPILGSIAQAGLSVQFEVGKKMIHFQPHPRMCSQL